MKHTRYTHLLAALILTTLVISACGLPSFLSGGSTMRGSGNVISEDRNVSGFNKVSVSGSGNLHIVQGDEESLTIEAEDNILPLITAKVSENTLKIGFKPGTSISTTKSIEFYLKVKDLDSISASGSGNIDCSGLTADNLIIKVSAMSIAVRSGFFEGSGW